MNKIYKRQGIISFLIFSGIPVLYSAAYLSGESDFLICYKGKPLSVHTPLLFSQLSLWVKVASRKESFLEGRRSYVTFVENDGSVAATGIGIGVGVGKVKLVPVPAPSN